MQADAAVKDYMLLIDAKSILEKKKTFSDGFTELASLF